LQTIDASNVTGQPAGEGISLMPDVPNKQPLKYNSEKGTGERIVSWSPPVPNWNPWTSCNIDEGHMATVIFVGLSISNQWAG